MSRSLGDESAVEYGLIHEPEICHLSIEWNLFQDPCDDDDYNNISATLAMRNQRRWVFILASDGLWDTISVDDVARNVIGNSIISCLNCATDLEYEFSFCETDEDQVESDDDVYNLTNDSSNWNSNDATNFENSEISLNLYKKSILIFTQEIRIRVSAFLDVSSNDIFPFFLDY